MKRLMILFMVLATVALTAATISGNVDVETMVPDSLLTVTALEAGNPQNSQSVDVQDGSYVIEELEFGTYLVKLHTMGFHMFYDGVFTMAEATPIELTENNPAATGINFVFEEPNYGTIMGNIYGLEWPIEGTVKLYDQLPSETGVEPISEYVLEVSHFEFNELEFNTYYVGLFLAEEDPIYYEDTPDPEEAEEIEITMEEPIVVDVNFEFENLPEYGIISGMVNCGGCPGAPVEGTIKLYDQLPSEAGVEAIAEYELETRFYSFNQLAFGNYYVGLFMPDEEPIYYEDTLDPAEAEVIELTVEEPIADDIDFEMEGSAEYGMIYGHVSGAGQGAGGPMDGVVKLYDQLPSEPDVVAVAETNLNGNHFVFSQLEFGIYYVGLYLADEDPVYYEDTTDPSEAEPIELTSEDPMEDDIEFDLGDNQGGNTMIAGFIEGVSVPNSYTVALYDQLPVDPELQPVAEKMVNGFHYAFHNVAHGTYYLKCYNGMGEEQYYDGEVDPNNAEAVVISNEEPIALEINFEMEGEMEGDGEITGTVTDEDSEPIFNAVVHLNRVNNGGNQGGMPNFPHNEHTAEDGTYSLEDIGAGDYYLRVTKDGYPPVYHEDASHWQEATIITISDSTELTIDFTMQSMDTYEISGTVLDAEEAPIEGAIVFAQGTDCQNPGNPFNLNGPVTETDAAGNYSLELSAGDYIVGALAISANQQIIQFYDHKTNPLEADIVTVETDVEGINFDLTEPASYENNLSGLVSLEGGPAANAIVVAMSSDQTFATTVLADSTGYYQFSSLPEGEYYLAANVEDGINTFYPGVINFQNAETISVVGMVTDVNFEIIPAVGGGYFMVDGQVFNPNRGPVANTTVSFTDAYGNVVATAETDADGYYETDELTVGEIEGLATKIFYESDSEVMEISGDTTIDFTIQPTEQLSNDGTPDIPNSITTHNYPNPFNPSTTINFNIPAQAKVKVAVYNVKGEKVATLLNSELVSGSHSVVWNGKDRENKSVASGVYFYQIKTANTTAVRKIMMIK